jgi:REP element-mobilizing transposase RayT
MTSTLSNILIHAVFSTKNRAPLLDGACRAQLFAYIGGIVRSEGGIPLAVGGVADHAHVMLRVPPKIALSELMQKIKGSSSKWLNDQSGSEARFAWQKGYAAFSVSQSMCERVLEYIANQEAHHQRATFQEELIALLEKHGVAYDERYLFE